MSVNGINNGSIAPLITSALSEQYNMMPAATSVADARAIAAMAETDSFESKLRSAMTTQNDAELKDACVQFEELMLGIMFKAMKATIQRSELMPAAPGRDIYEQWQDDALMKKIAERGTFGLADMMYKQLSIRMKNAYELIDDD
ncbi:MAG: rod-binding protein [Oscillospiraceae bacterium]|nr:rod-binding protein [Oscillospiraceae bacterium]